MPTLQQMHRTTAVAPACIASMWLLRQELAFRHFYGMDGMHIGKHFMTNMDNRSLREDHLASSGVAGISGFAESSLCPGEAQARGFEHGHDKKTSIPKGHGQQYEDLRKLSQQSAEVGNGSHSDAIPLVSAEERITSPMENYNQRLLAAARAAIVTSASPCSTPPGQTPAALPPPRSRRPILA